jgi:hypothetical protein
MRPAVSVNVVDRKALGRSAARALMPVVVVNGLAGAGSGRASTFSGLGPQPLGVSRVVAAFALPDSRGILGDVASGSFSLRFGVRGSVLAPTFPVA